MTKQLLFMLATIPAMVSRRQVPKKEFQIGIRLTLYQDKSVISLPQNETFLCHRFTRFVMKYNLMSKDNLIVPILEEEVQSATAGESDAWAVSCASSASSIQTAEACNFSHFVTFPLTNALFDPNLFIQL